MDSPRINKNIKVLEKQVEPYSENKIPLVQYYFSEYRIYIGIVVAVFLALVLVRPSFLYLKIKDKKKISFQKLTTFWILGSLLIIGGVIGFNYYKERRYL